jgi:hypothetical protein
MFKYPLWGNFKYTHGYPLQNSNETRCEKQRHNQIDDAELPEVPPVKFSFYSSS